MAELEKKGGADTAEGEENERLLMEEVTLLDFDMLCAAVAMQAQKGKWGNLKIVDSEEENLGSDYYQHGEEGGVHRMWEGESVYGCLDDRPLALQSTCCPCYRFGKNMKRAGLGSCLLQVSTHLILTIISLSNLIAYVTTGRRYFLYLAFSFALSVGFYPGYHRIKIRKKFNIKNMTTSTMKGGNSSFDDCVYHIICPCCTLSQESRTLEMNNVEDGIWHGRVDTICIVSLSEDTKPYFELSPPPFVMKSPEFIRMHKTSNDNIHFPTSVVDHS
ncbi:hypothetical protein OROGR_001133 [Orobanche gracilis]